MKPPGFTLVLLLFFHAHCVSQAGGWSAVKIGAGSLNDVFFLDSARGWAVGDGGNSYQSNDGGVHWIPFPIPTARDLICVRFTGADTGFVLGKESMLFRTFDGGASWDSTTIPDAPSYEPLRMLHFRDGLAGWAWGGALLATTDAGASWNAFGPGGVFRAERMVFTDDTTGWLLSGGLLFRTRDWTDWTQVNLLPFGHDIAAPDPLVLFDVEKAPISRSVGFGKSTDGGLNWDRGISGIDSSAVNDFAFPDTGRGWFLHHLTYEGWTGGWRIEGSTDGGWSWETEWSLDSTHTLARLFALDARHAWVAGRIGAADDTGFVARYGPVIVSVGRDDAPGPRAIHLSGNYPNPFNSATTVSFEIDRAGEVELSLYGIGGERVAQLDLGRRPAGGHSAVISLPGLPSGVYFLLLRSGGESAACPLLLVR